MPWISNKKPSKPRVRASSNGKITQISWSSSSNSSKYAIQARYGSTWHTIKVTPNSTQGIKLNGAPEAIAVSGVDRYGTTSTPAVISR